MRRTKLKLKDITHRIFIILDAEKIIGVVIVVALGRCAPLLQLVFLNVCRSALRFDDAHHGHASGQRSAAKAPTENEEKPCHFRKRTPPRYDLVCDVYSSARNDLFLVTESVRPQSSGRRSCRGRTWSTDGAASRSVLFIYTACVAGGTQAVAHRA